MDRISLGNEAFEGRNNAYILSSGSELALVDTGISAAEERTTLRDGLAERGFDVADVGTIVLTHYHADHAGLAGEIQSESGATVYVHEADAPLVEQDPDTMAAQKEQQRRCFEAWNMPRHKRDELLAFLQSNAGMIGEPATVTPIEDGTVIEAGGKRLETVHTPGHTAGLCCFELDECGEAFVGDAILPVYTPNVGGADVRVERPLEQYLESLGRIIDRDWSTAWPGHRDAIENPTERARTIVEHHRTRTHRVIDVLDEHGPADTWTVSAHLFGELENIHIIHGPGEAHAHLDYLHREGVVELEDGEYRLLESPNDIDTIISH